MRTLAGGVIGCLARVASANLDTLSSRRNNAYKLYARTLSWYISGQLPSPARNEAAPADVSVVAHATQILSVEAGDSLTIAATKSGYKTRHLVRRTVRGFNECGMDALYPRHAGGRMTVYTAEDRAKIIAIARSTPDRERDGTCVW